MRFRVTVRKLNVTDRRTDGASYTIFYKTHIVNHIWSFSLPRDIWPWVALTGSRSFGVYWAVYHTQCIIKQQSYQAERPLVLILTKSLPSPPHEYSKTWLQGTLQYPQRKCPIDWCPPQWNDHELFMNGSWTVHVQFMNTYSRTVHELSMNMKWPSSWSWWGSWTRSA